MNIDILLGNEEEKPLEKFPANGGFTRILRTIACIGDSLASGEIQIINPRTNSPMGIDSYEHSWGQYMARMTGSTVYNFSRGGMTAKEYATSFSNEMGLYRPSLAADAYIIALGVNDLVNKNLPVGETADICLDDENKCADSFAGWIGHIILRYKKIAPEAKFFLVTIPDAPRGEVQTKSVEAHRELMYSLSRLFDNTYVIDLNKYAPSYGEKFRDKFMLRGHMNAMGYLLSADMICSYIDYIIRHNAEDFMYVGLSGYEHE